MKALASTEEKAILRYLWMRGETLDCHDAGHNIVDVLHELDEIDQQNEWRFGFSSYPDEYGIRGILGYLSSLGLLRTGYENPHVILTEDGKEFADHLEFSVLGEIAIRQHLEDLKKRLNYDVSLV